MRMQMTVAMWVLYVVGAPTGFFAGVVLPWACFVAFGVLAGVLALLLVVSGITRNPHVNERMLSVYSIRFHFARCRFALFFTVSHQDGLRPWTLLRDTACLLLGRVALGVPSVTPPYIAEFNLRA